MQPLVLSEYYKIYEQDFEMIYNKLRKEFD